MGKNLKGRNCGRGICQRKDGYYVARLVIRNGKRITKYFKTLPEARNWLEDMRYNNRHGLIQSGETTSLSEWFSYYMDNLCSDLATNTKNLYTAAYYRYINEEIDAEEYAKLGKELALKELRESMAKEGNN